MYLKTKYILPIFSTIVLLNNCSGGGSSSSSEIIHQFNLELENTTTTAILKSKKTVHTKYGEKTLLIWVSKNSFETSCTKAKCINQDMINKLSTQFLTDGENNDIYDWVTNIYGEEWSNQASNKYSDLIEATDEINILFTDIANDNSINGGIMGYFYAKDNFKKSAFQNSNEMIMFYVDSVMFANEEDGDFWQKEMYSTLAHEFQHMIHFYQKRVLNDTNDDTWVNELLSETTEDLVATKINHIGPRGVSPDDGSAGDENNKKGRYPIFNKYNTTTLSRWDNTLSDYSKVSSFGTFLIRNYGGAKVLHDIANNTKQHEDTIEYATGKDFGDLLQEWGKAVILSDIENPEDLPTYNFGDFLSTTYNDIEYDLGSINFFNYNPTPQLYSGSDFDTNLNPHSNLYYIVGENIDDDIDLNISLNSTTKANAIIKDNNGECNIQELSNGENTIDINNNSDVYIVITNTDSGTTSSIEIEHNAKYIATQQKVYIDEDINTTKQNKVPNFITEFNNNINLK